MRIVGDQRNFLTEYSNSLIPTGELPSIIISNGVKHEMNGALFSSQFLDTVARFPDTNQIVKTLKQIS